MSRIPLGMADDDGDDEEVELPCECCGDLTVYRLSLGTDDLLPCCWRDTCVRWVKELLSRGD